LFFSVVNKFQYRMDNNKTNNTDEIDLQDIDTIVETVGKKPGDVIPILQGIQEKYNYLPQTALERVCETTEITPASITGVASFYAQFRLKPAGKHFIKVCIGTACHVMGAETIYQAFVDHLQIPEGEDTDKDKLFTVEKVACLGCCMLAPAVQIDEITYGFVTTQKVPGVLRDFLTSQNNGSTPVKSSKNNKPISGEIRLCLCSSCGASGAREVFAEIKKQIASLGISAKLKTVGCTGMAYQTPMVEIYMKDKRQFRYGRVKPEEVRSILKKHFQPVTLPKKTSAAITGLLDKLYTDDAWAPITRYAVDVRSGPDATFTQSQQHLVTEHCGNLNPLDLSEYRKHGGFKALKRCLTELESDDIIREVNKSGLRGRGGAGFPTGEKWTLVKNAPGKEKYLICNGDEGDPGAFMDRMILESFPFRVIEGLIIASKAVGASQGILYVRAEYPLALHRIENAIQLCIDKGLLGDNILETGHAFHLKVEAGAGAFVCGEETALIAAIQGQRGMPRLRPPYPSEEGLWGKPTLVNNVETYASVPWIFRHGAKAFAKLGSKESKGTKTFALAGKIKRSGLIEVPMGMTLRRIVDEIGGGIPNGNELKAIQVGGPSGGCVPHWLADTPVDYEDLTSAGAMMGSGGMVVLDHNDCMVDIARYFMAFTQAESCGKCTFCRIGTKRMLEILENLCHGKGKPGDIERLEDLAEAIRKGSQCGLGKTAPNPVLSTLTYFREEYEAHIEGHCTAGKCKELITYSITDDCIGCTKCAQRCNAGAIGMKPYEKHEIDTEKCVRCDSCRQICTVDAVKVE
jgi:NADH-quinone oxidoreductase subunit F